MGASLVPFLEGLSSAEKSSAMQRFKPVRTARGAVLFGRGAKEPAMYWLVEGGVVLSRGDLNLHYVSAPAMIGQRSVFSSSGRHTTTATATSDALALRIDQGGYASMLAAGNVVATRLEAQALVHNTVHARALAQTIEQMPPQLGHDLLPWDRKPPGRPRWGGPRDALHRNPHLGDQPTTTINGLASFFHHVVVGRGVGLYRHGEAADYGFLHLEGIVGLMAPIGSDKRHFLDAPRSGDMHGIYGLLDGQPRPFTLVSNSQVDALAIRVDEARDLLRAHSPIGHAFRMLCLRSMTESSEALVRQVQTLERKRAALLKSQVAELYGGSSTPIPLRSRVHDS